MSNRKIAEFIFGMMVMFIVNELPQDKQLQMLENDLDSIQHMNLH